jgi:hypothetical protein
MMIFIYCGKDSNKIGKNNRAPVEIVYLGIRLLVFRLQALGSRSMSAAIGHGIMAADVK